MEYPLKEIKISRRSRLVVKCLRWGLRPLIGFFARVSVMTIVKNQVRLASRWKIKLQDLPVDYDQYVNGVPGPLIGDTSNTDKTAILYIHGGGFLIPAVPEVHLELLARMCRRLDAVGFMPDYRLAPLHKFPAALDDCERAYRGLLDMGFKPERIVIAGESAGGNLTLGLLQRIRSRDWPMPCCAIPISPVTELARSHQPMSRVLNRHKDPLIPISALPVMYEAYVGDQDATNPELSPIYADCRGFPPLYIMAGETEVLRDEAIIVARHAQQAGVEVKLEIWPVLPHAFPLFIRILPEALQARNDIIEFIQNHLGSPS